MGLLGINWFRTKKEKELEEEKLKLENQLLQAQITNVQVDTGKKLGVEQSFEKDNSEKLYKKVKFVNNVLTVVLNDGSIISKDSANSLDFQKVREAKTENEILNIIFPSIQNVISKPSAKELSAEKAKVAFDFLTETGDFETDGASLYYKGVKRSLPALLINKFVEVYKKGDTGEINALIKFWLKCSLNPNAQSAEDLYEFLAKHHFKIDKHGNFYAYRRVVSKDTANKDLVEFVSNTYTKVKSIWKKKPMDFEVWKDKENILSISPKTNDTKQWEKAHIGNLEQLYLDLPSLQEKTYTSAHTGKEDYRVGSIISMPRYEGNDNNRVSCSKGFHAASKEYNYSGFGDTPILVIINPMDVLAVPIGEDGKLRTCRWFFASILAEEEEHILDEEDFDVTELGDRFEELCAENLEEHVKNGFSEEVKRHTFTLSHITSSEIKDIVSTLNNMKNAISERVQLVQWSWDEEE